LSEKPLVIAHRGASAHAPENTVPAVAKAVEMNADAIELDVQATRDEVPVCFHDVRLDRITGSTKRVKKLTAAELAELDAGAWFGEEFKGTAIPTLEDALAAAGDKLVVLKLRELPKGGAFETALRGLLEKRAGRTIVAVPDSEAIKRNKEWSNVEWAFLADEKMAGWLLIDKSEKMGLTTVRAHREHADAKFVHDAHAKGMKVFVFYADEKDDIQSVKDLGVDGILTNRPDRAGEILQA
jgi:glycerophosphoryl diester phosphodiesterase